ncbi:hypothetical protein PHISCL_03122 [Aspergillus sclerotialis]|uniref:Uncharacterized protein n=1 Tax=Aspergillus sclerotialis TaxID=2070753 RepID=A0A3A3A3C8_9EURO|nr:hypothetical protein PHISCL_03122 [Aspergillus sclerotialis]
MSVSDTILLCQRSGDFIYKVASFEFYEGLQNMLYRQTSWPNEALSPRVKSPGAIATSSKVYTRYWRGLIADLVMAPRLKFCIASYRESLSKIELIMDETAALKTRIAELESAADDIGQHNEVMRQKINRNAGSSARGVGIWQKHTASNKFILNELDKEMVILCNHRRTLRMFPSAENQTHKCNEYKCSMAIGNTNGPKYKKDKICKCLENAGTWATPARNWATAQVEKVAFGTQSLHGSSVSIKATSQGPKPAAAHKLTIGVQTYTHTNITPCLWAGGLENFSLSDATAGTIANSFCIIAAWLPHQMQ